MGRRGAGGGRGAERLRTPEALGVAHPASGLFTLRGRLRRRPRAASSPEGWWDLWLAPLAAPPIWRWDSKHNQRQLCSPQQLGNSRGFRSSG